MKRTLFFMLAVLLSTLSASAYDFKVNGIAYSLLDNGQRAVSYTHLTLPTLLRV